jgi:hypothetical protein
VRQWATGFAAGASTSDANSFDPNTGLKSADNLQLAYGGTIGASYAYDAAGQRTRSDVTLNGTRTISDYTYSGSPCSSSPPRRARAPGR